MRPFVAFASPSISPWPVENQMRGGSERRVGPRIRVHTSAGYAFVVLEVSGCSAARPRHFRCVIFGFLLGGCWLNPSHLTQPPPLKRPGPGPLSGYLLPQVCMYLPPPWVHTSSTLPPPHPTYPIPKYSYSPIPIPKSFIPVSGAFVWDA